MFPNENEMADAQKQAFEHATKICKVFEDFRRWKDIFVLMDEQDEGKSRKLLSDLEFLESGAKQLFIPPNKAFHPPDRKWWNNCRRDFLIGLANETNPSSTDYHKKLFNINKQAAGLEALTYAMYGTGGMRGKGNGRGKATNTSSAPAAQGFADHCLSIESQEREGMTDSICSGKTDDEGGGASETASTVSSPCTAATSLASSVVSSHLGSTTFVHRPKAQSTHPSVKPQGVKKRPAQTGGRRKQGILSAMPKTDMTVLDEQMAPSSATSTSSNCTAHGSWCTSDSAADDL